jgi:hypothetical protein
VPAVRQAALAEAVLEDDDEDPDDAVVDGDDAAGFDSVEDFESDLVSLDFDSDAFDSVEDVAAASEPLPVRESVR